MPPCCGLPPPRAPPKRGWQCILVSPSKEANRMTLNVIRDGTSTNQEDCMFVSRPMLSAIGALAALGIGLGSSALAQWQNSPLMRSFANNWSSSSQNVVGQLASEGNGKR